MQFENLIFDLTVSRGAANVAWRTPGADGGRDIEAEVSETDFSGAQQTRKWFIECKRYARAVDWPTIYEKLAYADSHQADVLLMCTTSKFSTNAISQAQTWNTSHRRPLIRLWPRHELDIQLKVHPDLLCKYGLASTTSLPGNSIVTLALALSKTVSSHYSRLVFSEASIDPMLEAAQAVADLLSIRMEDMEKHGHMQPSQESTLADSLGTLSSSLQLVRIDGPGLRAFVKYLAALTAAQIKIEYRSREKCSIVSTEKIGPLVRRFLPVFNAIATWSDFEFDIADSAVDIRQRT